MTNKYFSKEDIKGWAYFLTMNVDQLEDYNLTDLIYNSYITYNPDKDQVVLMYSVDNKYLSGDLYLTFPRDILGVIKEMPNDEAFFNNKVGFGFIPNPITK